MGIGTSRQSEAAMSNYGRSARRVGGTAVIITLCSALAMCTGGGDQANNDTSAAATAAGAGTGTSAGATGTGTAGATGAAGGTGAARGDSAGAARDTTRDTTR